MKAVKETFSIVAILALCAGMYYLFKHDRELHTIALIMIAAGGFSYDTVKILKSKEYSDTKGSDLFPIGVSATERRIVDVAKSFFWSVISPIFYTGIGFIIWEYFIACLIVVVAFTILYHTLEHYSKR